MPSPREKPHAIKKRVSKACDCCRKSKTKCDGMRPCSRCLQDNKICTYMSKKKADQMYPASYVDLLETRVSILVQSLTTLLQKSSKTPKDLLNFCNDPEILNGSGDFDINKVICKLLPNEKLQNLSESNENYSLDDITNVSMKINSNNSSASNLTRSPSPPRLHSSSSSHSNLHSHSRSHSHSHCHTAPKTLRRHSEIHIKKPTSPILQSPTLLSPTSSAPSFLKPKKRITSFDETLLNPSTPSSLDVNLDTILYEDSANSNPSSGTNEFESMNFSDTNSNSNSTLMSPAYSLENDNNANLPTSLEMFNNSNWTSKLGTNTTPILNSSLNPLANYPSNGLLNTSPFDLYELNWDEDMKKEIDL